MQTISAESIPDYSHFYTRQLAKELPAMALRAQVEFGSEGSPTLKEELPSAWESYQDETSAYRALDQIQRNKSICQAGQGPWVLKEDGVAQGVAFYLQRTASETPEVLYRQYPGLQLAEFQYWTGVRSRALGAVALGVMEKALDRVSAVPQVVAYGMLIPTDKNKMQVYFDAGFSPIGEVIEIPDAHPDSETPLRERQLWVKEIGRA